MTYPDVARKRQLFQGWLASHATYSTWLATAGQPIDPRVATERIARLADAQRSPEYLYVLTECAASKEIPAYIGKSRTPARRWSSHLQHLARGEKGYARWQRRLLEQGRAVCDLKLYVIGQHQVQAPPLEGFPTTIGALEYQLIGLAADAFTVRLLNSEGQAR
ncbi:hypothetical protein HNR42_003173 [Deinobacterium chartae]|uniref:GIY-YIG domain-containing protein n=1 Tax=Deinobacterium chartae TaxID=521158 RepID=A0A841I7B8_9DEIO|nr:GIY-YIG nuclease family protein [Deinobacterium chartae]MBB6099715.1 hypothetical protein [Deinobacterium chartae]